MGNISKNISILHKRITSQANMYRKNAYTRNSAERKIRSIHSHSIHAAQNSSKWIVYCTPGFRANQAFREETVCDTKHFPAWPRWAEQVRRALHIWNTMLHLCACLWEYLCTPDSGRSCFQCSAQAFPADTGLLDIMWHIYIVLIHSASKKCFL